MSSASHAKTPSNIYSIQIEVSGFPIRFQSPQTMGGAERTRASTADRRRSPHALRIVLQRPDCPNNTFNLALLAIRDILTPMNDKLTLRQLFMVYSVLWIVFLLFGLQIDWGHHMRLSGILIGYAAIALFPPVFSYSLFHLVSWIYRALRTEAQI